jgi:hypothetical protein
MKNTTVKIYLKMIRKMLSSNEKQSYGPSDGPKDIGTEEVCNLNGKNRKQKIVNCLKRGFNIICV